MDFVWWVFALILIGCVFFVMVYLFDEKKKEEEFCEKYREICVGMLKNQVIFILGDNYTVSYLKNDIEKLEWRYRHMGFTGRVTEGVYAHSGSFTRRVSVKIKDNRVVEVNSINMD